MESGLRSKCFLDTGSNFLVRMVFASQCRLLRNGPYSVQLGIADGGVHYETSRRV